MQMRVRLILALLSGALITTHGRSAEAGFSQAISKDDFSAAGLGKLSPAEIARLDALVQGFNRGVTDNARPAPLPSARGSNAVVTRTVPSEATVAATDAKAAAAYPRDRNPRASGSSPAKVTLSPGTEVEYAAVESRIAGDFRGWEGRTLFVLENGQRWQAAGTGSYVTPPLSSPVVKIVPGMLGSFWMTIEGVKPRVKVSPVTTR